MAEDNPADIASLFVPPPDAVIETHISRVFLSGSRAWKLKKAVTLPYVDFSTLEQRRIACEREVELNRRTAPELYLGVRAVGRDADGRLTLDGTAAPVEWLVEMRRFDPGQTLDHVVARGGLDAETTEALAETIARFHQAAAPVAMGAEAALSAALAANERAFAGLDPAALPAADLQDFRDALPAELARQAALLAGRQAAGHIRRGHGDLHLRNIVLIDGRPVLFDCLEFDDRLATCDTLYDFAFLLMDLLVNRQRALASRALNRYLEASDDYEGAGLLPLYIAVRAAVRCHIVALKPETWPQARQYLALARAALQPRLPQLIAIGGLSGTGKSTVARQIAPRLPGICGAVILRSDVIRKRLHGCPLDRRLPDSGYSAEAGRQTYATLYELARRLLAGGNTVILDAVFGQAGERAAAAALAAAAGAPFSGFWLTAPAEILMARVTSRHGDASDATADIVRWQQQMFGRAGDWRQIDAGGSIDDSVAHVLAVPGPGWLPAATAVS